MTELKLREFIDQHQNEVKVYHNFTFVENMKDYATSRDDFWEVLLLVAIGDLSEFVDLIGIDSGFLEDYDLKIGLRYGYVVIDLMEIMNEFDIEPLNIFSNEEV